MNGQSMTHSSAFALLVHQAYQTFLAVFCLLWKFPVTILHSWILQFHLICSCHWKVLLLAFLPLFGKLWQNHCIKATVWLVTQHILPSIFIFILFLFSISLFPVEKLPPLRPCCLNSTLQFLPSSHLYPFYLFSYDTAMYSLFLSWIQQPPVILAFNPCIYHFLK